MHYKYIMMINTLSIQCSGDISAKSHLGNLPAHHMCLMCVGFCRSYIFDTDLKKFVIGSDALCAQTPADISVGSQD